MKLLTVVFPLYNDGTTDWILMGKQAPGKRMPGVRNGPGGKCEEGEDLLDCAVREVREEIGVKLKKEDLKYVAVLIEGEKHVHFYRTMLASKISVADNEETVDCTWFDIEKVEGYIHEMLPGNESLMREVIRSVKAPQEFTEFTLDMSGNKELQEATKNIFGKLS